MNHGGEARGQTEYYLSPEWTARKEGSKWVGVHSDGLVTPPVRTLHNLQTMQEDGRLERWHDSKKSRLVHTRGGAIEVSEDDKGNQNVNVPSDYRYSPTEPFSASVNLNLKLAGDGRAEVQRTRQFKGYKFRTDVFLPGGQYGGFYLSKKKPTIITDEFPQGVPYEV